MTLTRAQLLRMSPEQLDALFGASEPGPLPQGEATGTAIVCAGSCWAKIFAWLARWFLWQGKVFDPQTGYLKNRVTPFGFRAIKARVYPGKSWFDQKDCIVIDYSETSLVARMVRDEIRQVAPGLYLGKVFLWSKPSIHFSVSYQYEPAAKFWRRLLATFGFVLLILVIYLAVRLMTDHPVTYAAIGEHFKYGSTGGERGSGSYRGAGIPLSLWKLLPELFPEYLPGKGYQSLGFIYEEGRDLPIGVSKRHVQGIDRVFLNCAICHVGSVRDTPQAIPRIILGMPSNTVDLQGFQRFLTACVRDERFTSQRLVPEIAQRGTDDWLNRQILCFFGIPGMRDRLLLLGDRFSFMDREPDFGPGRVDTFNAPKVLLNFRMDKVPYQEWVGVCDFPSIWNQRKREGMWLHWDGNNNSVQERNRSASFGTGAIPPTLDRKNIKRIEDWLLDAAPPPYPYPIDRTFASRGEPLYQKYCASCHGKSGTDFSGEYVGKVTPIGEVGTDRWRLDSYSYELCANQNLLYAGYGDERFSHFRKTFGYANAPLDGLWLRAPYLHNGSVPTLRDLLEPANQRPVEFYRGYDVFDAKRVGFISNVGEENGRRYFLYRARYPAGDPRANQPIPGNGNFGHEGDAYGTNLTPEEKDALVEYLKTF
jgi:hypothetical protein